MSAMQVTADASLRSMFTFGLRCTVKPSSSQALTIAAAATSAAPHEMGFRISTEVARFSLDMVWAEIAVAAIAGSAFYGLIALVERAVTFWHPSYRSRKDQ